MTTIQSLPRARRHTWHFLRFVRAASPVYLDTEVDATELMKHKRVADRIYSVVTYVTRAASRAVAEFPDTNAATAGWFRPRIATTSSVDVKLTVDKFVSGQRAVFSVVLPGIGRASLDEIQDAVDRLRDSDATNMPELRAVRALQRLPVPVGLIAFGWANRLTRRHKRMGTVAVTSLGHRPVLRFFSSGGTALTFGLGQIVDRPVARNGEVCVAPILPVSLTFDHRVLDGALAADVLATVKYKLEELE